MREKRGWDGGGGVVVDRSELLIPPDRRLARLEGAGAAVRSPSKYYIYTGFDKQFEGTLSKIE